MEEQKQTTEQLLGAVKKSPATRQKKAAPPQPVKIEPLAKDANPLQVIEVLLKNPGRMIARLKEGEFGRVALGLFGILGLGFLVYGLITGSFSMGDQLWIAPLKILGGVLVTGLICFPSFYIFACLGQADLSLKQAFVLMLAGLTLISILLIGFSPVAWVFSTSTDSIAFMGFFHLAFWFISVGFGMRMIFSALKLCNAKRTFYVRFWVVIFFITSLQMMTAIRPIIGTSEKILPTEKKFFIENWIDCMGGKNNETPETQKQQKKDRAYRR